MGSSFGSVLVGSVSLTAASSTSKQPNTDLISILSNRGTLYSFPLPLALPLLASSSSSVSFAPSSPSHSCSPTTPHQITSSILLALSPLSALLCPPPTLSSAIRHSFILDAWQYFFHRLFHLNTFLYRHVHSVHHRLYVPYAFGALYNHPLEGFVLDSLGAVVSEAGARMTTRQA